MSCYYPNGDLSTDGDIPCSTSGYGPCCPANWQCESNGLCYLANEGYYGRYTCTDETWQSSSCPQICTYGIVRLLLAQTEIMLTEGPYLTAAGNEAVLECTSGSYCCDTNRPELSGGTACCEASTSRFSLAALPLLPPYNDGDSGGSEPSVASSSAAASPSTIPPPSAVPSSTAAQTSDTPSPPSSTTAQTSNTPPPSSTPPSNTLTPTFLTSFTPLSSSTAQFTTPTSTPQTFFTSITPSKVTSSSSLSTAGSSIPSAIFVTEIITSDGSKSTVSSSATSNVAEPGSTLSRTKHSNIGRDVALGVCLPLAALAAIALFWYWRRKRSGRSTPTPRILQTDFKPAEPKSSAFSPFPHSPSTAPPDSHRSSTLVGTQTQPPQSAELQGSPTAGTLRNSRGSDFTGGAGTGATTSSRQSEVPAMREGGVGNTNVAELPGATSTYRPYRPPGWA